MRKLIAVVLMVAGIFAGVAFAQGLAPKPILPDTLQWGGPPNMPKVRGAWVLGGEDKPGPYIFRVKLGSRAIIPPHTHPDERNTTVFTGTIYVGFSETLDESKAVAVPAGAVYVAPANVPHYVWAKEGDATYQEAGFGPTRTDFIKK